jgi:hypothetical protein
MLMMMMMMMMTMMLTMMMIMLCVLFVRSCALVHADTCCRCSWDVDFVMTGHVHYYERLCAVENMYAAAHPQLNTVFALYSMASAAAAGTSAAHSGTVPSTLRMAAQGQRVTRTPRPPAT